MKILLSTSRAVPSGGGIASYNQELVNLLKKNNIVYLLTDSDEVDVNGYEKTYSTFGKSTRNFEYCSRLINHINAERYDVIINSASKFIPIIAPFLNSKILSVSHFVNGPLALNAGYNSKYINGIIALSNYGRKFLIKKFNIQDQDKVKVIYNFVGGDSSYDSGKIQNPTIRIIYPGGTSISKSFDVIQRLVYKLQNSDIDFEFIWIGETRLPAYKFSLLGLKDIKQLFKADPRIKIIGLISREEAVKIISSANIFILPSRLEGCPIALLEAMRGGCIPIVSDAQHGSREIIEKTGAGIIVRQGSCDELFNVIKEIVFNRDSFEEYYNKSREAIRSDLSEEQWQKQMNEALKYTLNAEKQYLPLTKSNYIKSETRIELLYLLERLKKLFKSLVYRIKVDMYFLRSKSIRTRSVQSNN